mmetsp:Transcript_18167/g.44568  ORF Transcript_18167/g.44568 Transcript_18167/m.44568 type:complete len:212 (-) Transcript_18167:80-715(-)
MIFILTCVRIDLRESVFTLSSSLRLLFVLVEFHTNAALSAVVAIEVDGKEYTGAAYFVRTLLAEMFDLPHTVDLVITQDGELDLLMLVLLLLWFCEDLLFPLLTTSAKVDDKVEGGLFGDIEVGQCAVDVKGSPAEDEAELTRDRGCSLDLALDLADGGEAVNLEGDCVPREGADKDLHGWCFAPLALYSRKGVRRGGGVGSEVGRGCARG